MVFRAVCLVCRWTGSRSETRRPRKRLDDTPGTSSPQRRRVSYHPFVHEWTRAWEAVPHRLPYASCSICLVCRPIHHRLLIGKIAGRCPGLHRVPPIRFDPHSLSRSALESSRLYGHAETFDASSPPRCRECAFSWFSRPSRFVRAANTEPFLNRQCWPCDLSCAGLGACPVRREGRGGGRCRVCAFHVHRRRRGRPADGRRGARLHQLLRRGGRAGTKAMATVKRLAREYVH